MPTTTPQTDSASAAVATLIARFGCVLMAVLLGFRRPPIGRTERAEPASVAIRLRSCCSPAHPERDRATWLGRPNSHTRMPGKLMSHEGSEQERMLAPT